MLNRKLLALVLPAVAVSALVGSGFSAWYFAEENIGGVGQEVKVSITDKVDESVGTLALNGTQATKLTLDQGGFVNRTALDKGISFDEESVGATFTFNGNSFTNLDSAGMKVKVTRTITFTKNLLDYVEVTGLSNYTVGSTVHTVTQDVTSNTLTDTIKLMSEDEDYTFLILKYKEGKKPQNSTDYAAMVTNLKGASITFNWTAEVVAKA